MLTNYLHGESWHPVMQGVEMCKLNECLLKSDSQTSEEKSSSGHTEIFFCCEGSFLLVRKRNSPMRIGSQEIFILSGSADIKLLSVTEPLSGYLISVDEKLFMPRFKFLCQILGDLKLCNGRVANIINSCDGAMRIHSTAWSRSAFSTLCSLPYQEQGSYAVMKILELFYLMCVKDAVLEGLTDLPPSSGYCAKTIRDIHSYMEEHLDEKLTIPFLSREFNISSTALKSGFREVYGQPVHSFLKEKRIEKAAELLSFSRLTVLQIAEAVGYEGVSQFNLVFKKQYGVTPSQFRKMSEPARV